MYLPTVKNPVQIASDKNLAIIKNYATPAILLRLARSVSYCNCAGATPCNLIVRSYE